MNNLGLGTHVDGDKVSFKVWAPFAKNVEVLINDNGAEKTFPMSVENGYWSLETSDIQPGQNYHYLITDPWDNKLQRNDPRARRLTASNGGWSVVIQDDFDWSGDSFTPQPINQQVIYELHVGTFNKPDPSTPGTFKTIAEKLDYLKDLGITAIELLPITNMVDDSGWGYSPTHIFSIEETYGSRHDLMELVKQAHEKNIAVILDMVYNHLTPQNNLYQLDGWNENYHGGIYFYNDERAVTPWGDRYDYGREEVRSYLLDNVRMWFEEFHIDGLRLDATSYISRLRDNDGRVLADLPEGYSLLRAMTDLAHELKPGSLMLAEDTGFDPNVTSGYGLHFDAQWSIVFPNTLRTAMGVVNSQNLDTFVGELQRYFNDDGFQKVIYADSHDSAAGGHERLNAEADSDADGKIARSKTLIAQSLTLTAPGVPMLLQGEEFVEDGYFTGWKALDWRNAEKFSGLVQAHRDLIALRRLEKALQGNGFKISHINYSNGVLGYRRWYHEGEDDVLVLVNFNGDNFDNYQISLPNGEWELVFDSQSPDYSDDFSSAALLGVTAENDLANITIGAYQALIYKRGLR